MVNETSTNQDGLASHNQGAPLRSLGPLEQYSVIRSRHGIYLNVCVTAIYSRQSTEPLRLELFRALAAVVANHPIMGAIPIDSSTGLVFTQLEKIDLDKAVSFRNISRPADALKKGDLDMVLEQQHNHGFTHQDSSAPFWRLCVLCDPNDSSSFVVVFCFHHALIDTKSALIFLEDLEYALSNPVSLEVGNIVTASKEMISPPLESLLELGPSPEFLHRQQTLNEPPANVWSGAPQRMPSFTRFSSLWLSASVTIELQRQSKLQGTALTALLMSLIANACFKALGSEITVLHGDCAVSLRRFCSDKLDERMMGCHVTSFSQVYSRSSSCIWDDARRTKAAIERTLCLKGVDSSASYLQTVLDIGQWLIDKHGKKRWPAWELSNVGTLDRTRAGSSGSYTVESVLFSQSASACSAAIKISAASGRDGQLALGLSYQQHVVDESLIKDVTSNLKDAIAQITCETDVFP